MTLEEKREYDRKYRAEHREAIQRKQRAWSLANKDKHAISQKKSRRKHIERVRAYARDYKLGIAANDHFLAQLKIQGNYCALCSKEFVNRRDTQQDHNHATNQFPLTWKTNLVQSTFHHYERLSCIQSIPMKKFRIFP